eukprot:TRINITY_DN55058_c0_g1_i1.p1 TRINITY_DN55058_c0_g1~~TRINITY_DN55058_c0_g1_i1.p1  ORF type:complete len:459 (+),score=145.68 TRINITY_DN55058_c0_g1_i1:65-1378(+)
MAGSEAAADEQGQALRAVAGAHRSQLEALQAADGSRARLRGGFRRWHRDGQLPAVAAAAFEHVLAQERYNRAHWRNTAQMTLYELGELQTWTFRHVDAFVHRALRGDECSRAAQARILREWPRLRQVASAELWMENMMMPFRSAVIQEVALRLAQQALELPCDDGDDGSAEWRHLLGFSAEGRQGLVAASDAYEEALLGGRRAGAAVERLREAAAKGHIVAAYYYAACACAGLPEAACARDSVEPLLSECAEQGLVPAHVALGSVLLLGLCGVRRDRACASLHLQRSLERGAALQFPLAAYLLAQAHDGLHGGQRQPRIALRWYQECSDLCEASDEDGRGWAPGGGRVFAFWPRREKEERLADASDAERRARRDCQQRQRSIEAELQQTRETQQWRRRNVWQPLAELRRSPHCLTYAVLSALIAAAAVAVFLTQPEG